jgi:hypothetical protein
MASKEPTLFSWYWGTISIRTQTFRELASYVRGHSEIWVGTLGDVVRYIQEANAFSAEVERSGDNYRFRFLLTWPLDAKNSKLRRVQTNEAKKNTGLSTKPVASTLSE